LFLNFRTAGAFPTTLLRIQRRGVIVFHSDGEGSDDAPMAFQWCVSAECSSALPTKALSLAKASSI
jgi:hypothetical protein